MEIENTSLYREVQAIINSPAKPVHYSWAADIHANGETHRAMKVLSIDFSADYEANFGEEIICTLLLAGGTFSKRIYPYQSNMDVTLYRLPLMEVGDSVDEEKQPQSERYAATLLDRGNPMIEANTGADMSEETLNLGGMWQISFQLVNKALEQLRMVTVGGVFRASTNEEVIKDVLTRESQRLVVEGARMPQGVDMVEASNQQKRDHVVIPQGTRLVEVPLYLHHKCGGVYSSGLGYYMQGDHWYVYPCYDTKRFTKASRTLTVVNIPPNKFPGIERTYRQDGKNTVVLATSELKIRDDTDAKQLNEGNGVRFADANKFMDGFAQTQNNKTVLSRGANASEFLGDARPNGNNNVQMSDEAISANPFMEYSKIARRQGSFVSFVWENSLPSVVFPGMMVKLLYLLEDEVREVYGVVLKAHHYVSLRGHGLTATRYQTNSSVYIFIQPVKESE